MWSVRPEEDGQAGKKHFCCREFVFQFGFSGTHVISIFTSKTIIDFSLRSGGRLVVSVPGPD
jgi:hypothetical protein